MNIEDLQKMPEKDLIKLAVQEAALAEKRREVYQAAAQFFAQLDDYDITESIDAALSMWDELEERLKY